MIASTLPAKDIFFLRIGGISINENTCRNCEWIALVCNFSMQLYFLVHIITHHYFFVEFNDKLHKYLFNGNFPVNSDIPIFLIIFSKRHS